MKFSLRRNAGALAAPAPPVSVPPAGSTVRVVRARQASHADMGGCEAVATSVDGPLVELHPESSQAWMEGQRLNVSWHEEAGVRIVEALVESDERETCTVRMLDMGTIVNEQRRHRRERADGMIDCEIIASRVHQGRRVQIQLDDMSEGGVGFRSSLPLAPGDVVRLLLEDGREREAAVTQVRGASSSWRMRISAHWID
jgi:hypothetical protein